MLTPWYITGFCDGEAAFTYSKSGNTFSLYFSIRQREDNQKIIEYIQEYFHSIGNIYRQKKNAPTKNSDLTQPSVYYRVSRIGELKVIVDHFDKYPLQSIKKQEAYKTWREMVIHKLENYRNINYDELRVLAEKLSRLNSKSRAFSRSSDSIRGGIPPKAGKVHTK